MSSTPTLILYLHIKFKAHSYPVKWLVTSSFSLRSANISSYTAIPQRVTCSRAPPNNRGCVLNSQDSLKMPALSDLKIKENFLISPGNITPEIRENASVCKKPPGQLDPSFPTPPRVSLSLHETFPIALLVITLHPAMFLLPDLLPATMLLNRCYFHCTLLLQRAQYSLWQILPSLPSDNDSLLNIPPIYIQNRSNLLL